MRKKKKMRMLTTNDIMTTSNNTGIEKTCPKHHGNVGWTLFFSFSSNKGDPNMRD
jgi:hypothetical protein